MTFQEMFREEFYEEFKNYPAYAVVNTIKFMSKARMATFYLYYKKGSKANLNSSSAKELIQNLKKSIDENFSKKRFSQVFSYNIESVKQKFNELTKTAQVSLLKEYTFNEFSTEYKSNLSDNDIEANKKYIEQLRNMIKTNNSWYKSFFENFRVSREILLLAIILLDKEDKEYLVLKYDENLCRKNRREDVGSEVISYVSLKVMPKIERNIESINKFIPTNLLETLKSMLNIIDTSQIFTNLEMVERINSLIADYIYKINICEVFSNINSKSLSELVNKLPKKERDLLLKEYSFDYNSRRVEISEEERNINKTTIEKLKIWIDNYLKYSNFVQFFDSDWEHILSILNNLELSDKEFLSNMYKNGYSNEPNVDMIIYKKHIDRLEVIIRKINNKANLHNEKVELSKEKVALTIFDVVKSQNLNEIIVACEELNIIEYMRILFGENLDGEMYFMVTSLERFMTSSIVYRLNSQIENKKRQKQNISLYEYYISYKRDNESLNDFKSRLNEIIRTIDSKKVKTILFNRFYDDVKDVISIQDIDITNTSISLSSVNAMITNKLALQNLYYARERGLDYKETLFNRRSIFLVEHFYDGVSLTDIKSELNLHNERTIELFKLKFGENLDELGKVGIFDSKDLELMQRVMSKINKKLYLKDLLLNIVNKFRTTLEFNILKEEFGEKESLIIMSEKYLGNYLNAQEVIEYCDMTLNLRRKK